MAEKTGFLDSLYTGVGDAVDSVTDSFSPMSFEDFIAKKGYRLDDGALHDDNAGTTILYDDDDYATKTAELGKEFTDYDDSLMFGGVTGGSGSGTFGSINSGANAILSTVNAYDSLFGGARSDRKNLNQDRRQMNDLNIIAAGQRNEANQRSLTKDKNLYDNYSSSPTVPSSRYI